MQFSGLLLGVLHVWVFCLHACLCITCMQCQWRSEEGIGSAGTGVTSGCNSMWVLGMEPRSFAIAARTLNCSCLLSSWKFLISYQGTLKEHWQVTFSATLLGKPSICIQHDFTPLPHTTKIHSNLIIDLRWKHKTHFPGFGLNINFIAVTSIA